MYGTVLGSLIVIEPPIWTVPPDEEDTTSTGFRTTQTHVTHGPPIAPSMCYTVPTSIYCSLSLDLNLCMYVKSAFTSIL